MSIGRGYPAIEIRIVPAVQPSGSHFLISTDSILSSWRDDCRILTVAAHGGSPPVKRLSELSHANKKLAHSPVEPSAHSRAYGGGV